MRSRILAAKESFWLVPTIGGVAAVLLGLGLVMLDQHLTDMGADQLPFLSALSPSAGRSILSTIGTSMLTVAGTTFSITISVLATTSSTYGPRLVRNFMADRSNQIVLAVFTSTFVYCLVVLRAVRTELEDRSAFVPTIATHVGLVLGLADVAVLVYLIHHTATSVQITTLQKRVQADLIHSIETTRPDPHRRGWASGVAVPPGGGDLVRVDRDGYVHSVDIDAVLRIAVRDDLVLRLCVMPGDYLAPGEPIVDILSGSPADPAATEAQLLRAYSVGVERMPAQDVRFALQQMTEVAVRGLATGTNDPYTPISAMDLSRTALAPLVAWGDPANARLDDAGRPRVLFTWPATAELVGDLIDSMRQYGVEHLTVVLATFGLVQRLAEVARSDEVRSRMAIGTRALLDAYRDSAPASVDLEKAEAHGRAALAALARRLDA